MGVWARLTALAAVGGTGLAVVSGAGGWGTAHRVLAAVALPPLAALAAIAWVSARRLLVPALAALALFGLAALLTGRAVHLTFAAAALAATVVVAALMPPTMSMRGGAIRPRCLTPLAPAVHVT